MKELQEVEKVKQQAYALQLSTRQRKMPPVAAKCWFWLSIEACAAISTPAFLIVPLIRVSQFQSPSTSTKLLRGNGRSTRIYEPGHSLTVMQLP